MNEEKRLKARELLLRSRLYRMIGLVFAVVGILLFLFLYFKYIDGNVMAALKQPIFVIIVLIPFLPAFILSRMAIKAENGLMKLMEELQAEQEKSQDRSD